MQVFDKYQETIKHQILEFSVLAPNEYKSRHWTKLINTGMNITSPFTQKEDITILCDYIIFTNWKIEATNRDVKICLKIEITKTVTI